MNPRIKIFINIIREIQKAFSWIILRNKEILYVDHLSQLFVNIHIQIIQICGIYRYLGNGRKQFIGSLTAGSVR